MRSFHYSDWILLARKRFTATLLLVIAFVTAVPIPVFSLRTTKGKDRSRPFPCQDRPCGCRTAEQCKKKCCCFSAEQKMAWARKNNLDVSEIVELPSKTQCQVAAPRKSCCASQASKASSKDSGLHSSGRSKLSQGRTVKFVISIVAQGCHGVDQTVAGHPLSLPPVFVSSSWTMEPTGEGVIPRRELFGQPDSEPPVPPPRIL